MAEQAFKPYVLAHTFDHANARKVQFSPGGFLIAVVSDHVACTYLLSSLKLHQVYNGHTDDVTDVSFSHDSRLLATSSNDTTIRVWDAIWGPLARTFIGHESIVSCVKFHPTLNMIASVSFDETIRTWDVDTGECKSFISVKYSGPLSGVDFRPDGSMIVACSTDGFCGVWDTATGQRLVTIKPLGSPPITSVKFSFNGSFILVGTTDRSMTLWSVVESKLYALSMQENNPTGLSTFSGLDEKYLVSGSEDNCLCIREKIYGRLIQKFEAHTAPVRSASCHPTRGLIVSACPDDIQSLKLWTQEY